MAPATGDSGYMLWIVLIAVSLLVLILLFVPKRSREKRESAEMKN